MLFALHGILQALSISRSLTEAKAAAENGQVNCRELMNSVIRSVQGAGGLIDYAEVRQASYVIFLLFAYSTVSTLNIWFSGKAEPKHWAFELGGRSLCAICACCGQPFMLK